MSETTQPADEKAMETVNAVRRRALQDAHAVIEEWFRPGEMKLRAGEMTAQEARTARAILASIMGSIKHLLALTPCDDPSCEQCDDADALAAAPPALPADDVGEIRERHEIAELCSVDSGDAIAPFDAQPNEFLIDAHRDRGVLLQQNARLTADVYSGSIDLSSGFSCNGVTVAGSRKSIDAVREWHHSHCIVPQLKDRIKDAEQQHASHTAALAEERERCAQIARNNAHEECEVAEQIERQILSGEQSR